MGVINFRYRAGQLLKKLGYKLSRDYRWPEVHGDLLLLGFALLRAYHRGLIQIVQIGAFDGQRHITSSMFTFFKVTLKVWITTC